MFFQTRKISNNNINNSFNNTSNNMFLDVSKRISSNHKTLSESQKKDNELKNLKLKKKNLEIKIKQLQMELDLIDEKIKKSISDPILLKKIKKQFHSIIDEQPNFTTDISNNPDVAYIILYRGDNFDINHYCRLRNIYFTIYLSSLLYNFNIYITEIGKKRCPLLEKILDKFKNLNINHNLIINNKHYRFFDRAHGYNATIKHFIKEESVLIMGDCDLPLKNNISKLVNYIKEGKYYFLSPYNSIEKLENSQVDNYVKNQVTDPMEEKCSFNDSNLRIDLHGKDKNSLYTLTGGILIANRKIFEKLGLWYEYSTYGYEDRALDVILLEKYKDKILEDNFCYTHLWHPTKQTNNTYTINYNNKMYYKRDFHIKVFGCYIYDDDRTSMHSKCQHNHESIWKPVYEGQVKGVLSKYK